MRRARKNYAKGKITAAEPLFGDFVQEANEKFGAVERDGNPPALLDRLNVYRYNICGNPRKAQCGALFGKFIEERKC